MQYLFNFRILSYLNADPEEYSVIFTSGATAGLKLVGESFNFQDNDTFCYLTDSHTSVLGLREVVQTERIIPISRDQLLSDDIVKKSGLFALPAQCNYNGFKYPLGVVSKIHENFNSFVLLDAASYVSTSSFNYKDCSPDFMCLSFYKIFGYPDGLGALIVSKRGAERLQKRYYGGGTVQIALTRTNFHVQREKLHERFEDGTISFLSIIQLKSCFDFMENLLGQNFIDRISHHVFQLAKFLFDELRMLKHSNGRNLIQFHHDTNFETPIVQGGIVNFNLQHADESYVGYAEFSCIATLHNFIIRTGCFCNPGSCQTFLKHSNEELIKQFHTGHVCGDAHDLVDGKPTGSIRVSFGLNNTKEDVVKFLKMVKDCYLENRKVAIDRVSIAQQYKQFNAPCKLKSIRIYPIKSCGAFKINGKWTINEKGLKYDREWLVVDGNTGLALTQKHTTRMCRIKPLIDEEAQHLQLEFPGMENITISLARNKESSKVAKLCETKVCGDRVEGWDCGNEIADWLSRALEIDNVRLIKHNDKILRKNGSISLSNQAQFLIINESSVDWLMKNVDDWENDEETLENIVDRFRGNFIIENLDALDENNFKSIRIRDAKFMVQGPCSRCQMICIDQNTGIKTTEPLRTIGKLFKGKMRFGIYLKHSQNSSLEVKCGDEIFY